MATDVVVTFFKGILQGDKDGYLYAQERVRDEFFSGEAAVLWKLIGAVYKAHGEIIDFAVLQKLLPRTKLPVDVQMQTEVFWHEVEALPRVSDVDFKVALSVIEKDFRRTTLGKALTYGLEVLSNGVEDKKTGQILQGFEDSLGEVRKKLSEIETLGTNEFAQISLRVNAKQTLESILISRNKDKVPFGWGPLDEMTLGGGAPGEWVVIGAGTGVGKSMSCVNFSHHAIVTGRNVAYFTTETLSKQILERLAVRHSLMDHLGGSPGLSARKIKAHTDEEPVLSKEELNRFHRTVDDLVSNEKYGNFVVYQIPEGTRVSTAVAMMDSLQAQFPLHMVVFDSPEMFSSDGFFHSEREKLNAVANAMKSLAISFNNGKGILVASPWQTSRSGQERAKETGRYEKAAMSDTAMVEKRADLLITLLEDPEVPSKLKAQVLKYRDLDAHDFELNMDLDSCYIGSSESSADGDTSFEALL